jgi:hypothetical protein
MTSILTVGQMIAPGRAWAGPWTLQTSLSAAETYDDNISLEETNEESDFTTTLSPSVRLLRLGDRLTFSASYQAHVAFYAHNADSNNTSHTGQSSLGVIGLGPGLLQHARLELATSFTATERLVNFPAPGDLVGNGGVITKPNTTLSNRSSATLSMPFTDSLSGSTSYTRSFIKFRNPSLIDSTTQEVAAGFAYQFTSKITLGSEYTYRVIEFDVQGQNRRVAHEVGVTMAATLTQTLDLNLRAGETYFTNTNIAETVGAATLTKHFQHTEGSIGYTRSISSGGGLFGEPTLSQLVTVVITRAMGERAGASISGVYANNQPTGSQPGHSQSFNISASAHYSVTQWMQITGVYQHMAQQATGDTGTTANIRSNTIGVALNGTWERSIP